MQAAQMKVKAFELRKLPETDLMASLNRSRGELVKLRTSKVSSAPQVKLAHIKVRNHSLDSHNNCTTGYP